MQHNHLQKMYIDIIIIITNNNNKYLYSALSCGTQSAVTQDERNTILQDKKLLEFE